MHLMGSNNGDNWRTRLPEEELVPSVDFYWYATREDFDEEGNLSLEITSRQTSPSMGSEEQNHDKNLFARTRRCCGA